MPIKSFPLYGRKQLIGIEKNLLTAYRLLTHMKCRAASFVKSYIYQHMNLGAEETTRICRELKRYYREEAI